MIRERSPRGYADRVITVPWSPTVEETRAFAVAQCSHEWIMCLDDDECLSGEAIRFIQAELAAPRADIYGLLLRHYILGTHDEAAYYWPEHQIRLFRRGAVTFSGRVHGGMEVHSDSMLRVAPDTGAAIHNLSHEDVAQWIEKTNRYTSRLDRERVTDDGRASRGSRMTGSIIGCRGRASPAGRLSGSRRCAARDL